MRQSSAVYTPAPYGCSISWDPVAPRPALRLECNRFNMFNLANSFQADWSRQLLSGVRIFRDRREAPKALEFGKRIEEDQRSHWRERRTIWRLLRQVRYAKTIIKLFHWCVFNWFLSLFLQLPAKRQSGQNQLPLERDSLTRISISSFDLNLQSPNSSLLAAVAECADPQIHLLSRTLLGAWW